MTVPIDQNQVETQKNNDKEINFRNLEAKYQRQLEQERAGRLEAERLNQEYAKRAQQPSQDDEDESDPYVDHKKLSRKLNQFGQTTQGDIQKAMEMAKASAKEELRNEMWLENNPDFYEVLQKADQFAARAPKLADTILKMPEGFERQKLVYQNIKALGIDKPEPKQSSVQEKIDANRRSPFQPSSGPGNTPYAMAGDFSSSGQKNAYDKMQQLKNSLRLG